MDGDGPLAAARGVTPEDAQSMAQVRAGVDAVDRALVELLGVRARYMATAARIKPTRDDVRDEARKAQVLANVAAHARDHGLPEALTAELWERLVEWSIAYELDLWDENQETGASDGARTRDLRRDRPAL